ncbi:MAG: alpha-galactosidase [Clostridia bacterium]|nr:alpha-galactosidase [Clostridia bacterium]
MEKIFEISGNIYTFKTEEDVDINFEKISNDNGLSLYKVSFGWKERVFPKRITLEYKILCTDVYTVWDSYRVFATDQTVTFRKTQTKSRLASGMPLKQLFSKRGINRHLLAVSDVRTPMTLSMGSYARPAFDSMTISVDFFTMLTGPFDSYEAIIRIDEREIPFDEAVKDARKWYNGFGYTPAFSPEYAKLPMYSTWYSLWQTMTAEELIRECKEAVKYGMKSVIVDDGWQTDDATVVYGYTGDWQPVKSKFPDFKGTIKQLHDIGMKVILWFSVPYVGYFSKNYQRFKGMYITDDGKSASNCSRLDPRFKEVREFLVETYVYALKEWDLDGFKLDFIDNIESNGIVDERMDVVTIEEATEQLLKDVYSALTAIKPDIMIEFRQAYYGPVISAYGNMIRVGDCPLGSEKNKDNGIDLRLVSSSCAVHSDMIIWAKEDSDESVASQLWGTVFTVPQISVIFDNITDSQKQILKNYLDFWNEHRGTLTSENISATAMANGYSEVSAVHNGEKITLAASNVVFSMGKGEDRGYLINISGQDSLIVKSQNDAYVCEIFDCLGKKIGETSVEKASLCEVGVPYGGMVKVVKAN